MSNPKSAARLLAEDLVRRHHELPALTLARTAYAKMPEGWRNLESCRGTFRRILGVKGKEAREETPDKSLFREPRPAGFVGIIPEPVVESDWTAFEIPGPFKALVLSDVHIPFHDVQALELALQTGLDRRVDVVLLNGDICDHYALSRWETNPKLRKFPEEVKAAKQFLGGLRQLFPDARIVFKQGNHEERFERYLRLKAQELLGLDEFEWESVFGLRDHGIELVKDKRPVRLGQLNVIHGHEYVFNISNPVNPARGMYLRAKNHVLGGHFHQSSQHSEKSLEQKVISAWSTGCLCGLHPEYRPLNPWNHGFACVEVEANGAFHVDNLRIVEGKAY